MIDNCQHAYLDALGIDVWQLRKPARVADPFIDDAPGLKLGPGAGGTLLVCATDSDSASKLANDISRTLGSVPVWAWPVHDAGATGLTEAVSVQLFTTVAIFGDGLARRFFGDSVPASLLTSRVVLLPEMPDLQEQATARRTLWRTLCRTGMVKAGRDPA